MESNRPSGDTFIPPVLLASMDRIEACRKKRVVAHRIMSILGWVLFFGGFALALALPFIYIFQAGEETETAKAIMNGIPGLCCVLVGLVLILARLPLYGQLRTMIKKEIFEPSLSMSYEKVEPGPAGVPWVFDDFMHFSPYGTPPNDYCEDCTYRAEHKGLSFKASDVWYNFVVARSSYHKKLSASANGKVDCGRFMVIDLGRDFPHRLLVTSYQGKTSPLTKVDSEWIAFNEYYRIYSDDPLFAFYILTPQFQERIVSFAKRYPDKYKLSFHIEGRKAYLYLYNVSKGSASIEINKTIQEGSGMNAIVFSLLGKEFIEALALYRDKYQKETGV